MTERVSGSALLPVVTACAALAVVTAILLAEAAAALGAASYRRDGAQARRLALAGLDHAQRVLESGRISPPGGVGPVEIPETLEMPRAPAGFAPLPERSNTFPSDSARGWGVRVSLERVRGPAGDARRGPGGGWLVDAHADARFGRARALESVRFVVGGTLGSRPDRRRPVRVERLG